MTASNHGGDDGGVDKRSKSVMNSRATIVLFGSIRIKSKTFNFLYGIEPGTTGYKKTAIILSHSGLMPRQFHEFDSKSL